MTMAKYAFVQLKNGYTTRIPCEFFLTDEDKNRVTLWGEIGQVGLFQLDQVDQICLTEQKENKNDKD